MKISFAITTHNEGAYIDTLLEQLTEYCELSGDEVVVLDDFSDDTETVDILSKYVNDNKIKLIRRKFSGSFAEHKNFLSEQCVGDYIFQIDADEYLHSNLLNYLHDIVENNSEVDLFLIPRVNVVTGLTDDDAKRWGWTINENGWNCWPDYQTRLFRNHKDIEWQGNVHERIVGFKTLAPLPEEEEWAIYHLKDIERQRKQNDLYNNL
jgi:glycosyltransferase involved in cell wall biosynthesis